MTIRTIVRVNLTALLAAAGDGLIRGPATVYELEADSGIGKTTIYRILDPEADYLLTLTTLIKLAAAYDLPVWQFLYPQLDPVYPPHVLTHAERKEHEKWRVIYLQVQAIADDGRAGNAGTPGASDGNAPPGSHPGGEPLRPARRQKSPRP